MQRLTEALDALDAQFMVIVFRVRPSWPQLRFGVAPPMFFGGSPQQRLRVLDDWWNDFTAVPPGVMKPLLSEALVEKIHQTLAERDRLRRELES
jgi:hypothetical protein